MDKITVAKGNGIGPEIMDATLRVLDAAGASLQYDEIELGESVYLSGNTSGITDEAWDIIRKNKVLLKAPISTPQGKGYKSLNVTMRKSLGLFSNVRVCKSLAPFIATKHPDMDVVIIRENEEDLYAGIEHQQTPEVTQCLKLISRPGCEKIIRYAFEYAKQYNRKKVTCFVKDNIMKLTDGLFHQVFDEVKTEYPEIESDHYIVDIGAARIADTPEIFDVVVMPNLYGDIISDITAQISGSVGMVGSVNVGNSCTMFEAIHGSAPDIAGKGVANPSALLNSAVMMLNHLGQHDIAEKIANAWLKTMEDGVHTPDIFNDETSTKKASTTEFTDAIIANLGQVPSQLAKADFSKHRPIKLHQAKRAPRPEKTLVGVDLFADWPGTNPAEIADKLQKMCFDGIELKMITNRGVMVWPKGFDETFCTDHWRCRFQRNNNEPLSKKDVAILFANAIDQEVDVIKSENLYDFDGKPGYSLGQGQ